MPKVYYNEFDQKAAGWLRELMGEGLIPVGDVDERSIADVRADDLAGYGQCHFFAGIGGWALALRWAGLEGVPGVWTGSCPCQPFSCAGKGRGVADERHLWPVFARLVAECRPVLVFGEQVAGAIGHGWLDGVRADLEAEDYTVGAAVLGAHSVGAPHIRQRLYWGAVRVADAFGDGRGEGRFRDHGEDGRGEPDADGAGGGGARWSESVWWPCRDGKWRRVPGRWMGDATGGRAYAEEQPGREHGGVGAGAAGGVDDSAVPRFAPEGEGAELREQRGGEWVPGEGCVPGGVSDAELARRAAAGGGFGEHAGDESEPGCVGVVRGAAGHGGMAAEPALFPLADGVPGRVGLLRGAGNAIVPQVGAEFVREFCGAVGDLGRSE